tara:strand:- start:4573 stop:5232 length:660 start_codon:yes stop_codon:yes gene_type:complete
MLKKLYKPDGKMLTTMVVGRPGSGKSFFLNRTVTEYCKQNNDENWRLVYVCPKHEMTLFDEKPINVDALEKHLRKNPVAVVYPDPHWVEGEVEYVIDLLFAIKQSNPDFSATFLLDDAQTFLSSRRQASPQFRRLALTGRSKGIRFVAVSHSMIFNKDLEGSTSFIVNFTLPVKLFHKDAMTRYGFDFEPYVEPLSEREYSFVFYDVTKSKARLYEPIS